MIISKDRKFRQLLKNTLKSYTDVENRKNGLVRDPSKLKIPYRELCHNFEKNANDLLNYIDKYVLEKTQKSQDKNLYFQERFPLIRYRK